MDNLNYNEQISNVVDDGSNIEKEVDIEYLQTEEIPLIQINNNSNEKERIKKIIESENEIIEKLSARVQAKKQYADELEILLQLYQKKNDLIKQEKELDSIISTGIEKLNVYGYRPQ